MSNTRHQRDRAWNNGRFGGVGEGCGLGVKTGAGINWATVKNESNGNMSELKYVLEQKR